MDYRGGKGGQQSAKFRERIRNVPGFAAAAAEKRKRDAIPDAHKPGPPETMETRLRRQGITFTPIAFDTLGTPGREWSKFIKKLSSIAHSRRRHHPQSFKMKWSLRISVLLAKRGARVALRRAAALSSGHAARTHHRPGTWLDGPLGAPHAADLSSIQERGA